MRAMCWVRDNKYIIAFVFVTTGMLLPNFLQHFYQQIPQELQMLSLKKKQQTRKFVFIAKGSFLTPQRFSTSARLDFFLARLDFFSARLKKCFARLIFFLGIRLQRGPVNVAFSPAAAKQLRRRADTLQ